jgi:hypothetical protein
LQIPEKIDFAPYLNIRVVDDRIADAICGTGYIFLGQFLPWVTADELKAVKKFVDEDDIELNPINVAAPIPVKSAAASPSLTESIEEPVVALDSVSVSDSPLVKDKARPSRARGDLPPNRDAINEKGDERAPLLAKKSPSGDAELGEARAPEVPLDELHKALERAYSLELCTFFAPYIR